MKTKKFLIHRKSITIDVEILFEKKNNYFVAYCPMCDILVSESTVKKVRKNIIKKIIDRTDFCIENGFIPVYCK
ncbi:hypothetical protein JW960_21635 [candidate division KSB1 bacterium]|nr:hypothetical protein [candidate division KSB1 bacterium]